MINRVLIFDIWADFAHFKRYYTTTSPLTFSIPPKTTIYGILAAIIGLDKNEYLEYFQGECQVGIQILKPIKKIRMGLNLIDVKKCKTGNWHHINGRTQIRTEFLSDPAYRFYIYHQNPEIYRRLKENLSQHVSYYTVSLGLSENIANFKYIGEETATMISQNQDMVELYSAFRIDQEISKGDIDFLESGKEYFSDKVALEMKPDREVVDYGQVLFERNGKTIRAKPAQYYKLSNGENIILL